MSSSEISTSTLSIYGLFAPPLRSVAKAKVNTIPEFGSLKAIEGKV